MQCVGSKQTGEFDKCFACKSRKLDSGSTPTTISTQWRREGLCIQCRPCWRPLPQCHNPGYLSDLWLTWRKSDTPSRISHADAEDFLCNLLKTTFEILMVTWRSVGQYFLFSESQMAPPARCRPGQMSPLSSFRRHSFYCFSLCYTLSEFASVVCRTRCVATHCRTADHLFCWH